MTKALEPAQLKSIELDETRKRVKILVSEDQLSLAIGKRGQNARLTARLTGWEVDIDAEHIVTKGFDEKMADAVEALAAIPGVTREQADALVHNGVHRLEDLLSAEASDISDIPADRRKRERRFWKPREPKPDAARCPSGKRL